MAYRLFGIRRKSGRAKVEDAYMDDFTRSREAESYERVMCLDRKVRAALNDDDPYERLYSLANELESALNEYELCRGRRLDYVTKRF